MKVVDIRGHTLVHSGRSWDHPQPPCSREMIRFLEKDEGFVTWLQPDGGAVQDQFPVIRTVAGYCTMSLRMMKAVWRHVRLRKGFVNVERAPYGGLKLRIPHPLFVEKMRTQTRFNVSAAREPRACVPRVLKRDPPQMMRMDAGKTAGKERKTVQNASAKVNLVVQRMLLPLLDVPMRSHVSFDSGDEEAGLEFMDHVSATRPELLTDEDSFVQHARGLFQRYVLARAEAAG